MHSHCFISIQEFFSTLKEGESVNERIPWEPYHTTKLLDFLKQRMPGAERYFHFQFGFSAKNHHDG